MNQETNNSTVDRDSLASEYLDRLLYTPYPVQEEALLTWHMQYLGDTLNKIAGEKAAIMEIC